MFKHSVVTFGKTFVEVFNKIFFNFATFYYCRIINKNFTTSATSQLTRVHSYAEKLITDAL